MATTSPATGGPSASTTSPAPRCTVHDRMASDAASNGGVGERSPQSVGNQRAELLGDRASESKHLTRTNQGQQLASVASCCPRLHQSKSIAE